MSRRLFLQQAPTVEALLPFVDRRVDLLVCNARLSKFLFLVVANQDFFEQQFERLRKRHDVELQNMLNTYNALKQSVLERVKETLSANHSTTTKTLADFVRCIEEKKRVVIIFDDLRLEILNDPSVLTLPRRHLDMFMIDDGYTEGLCGDRLLIYNDQQEVFRFQRNNVQREASIANWFATDTDVVQLCTKLGYQPKYTIIADLLCPR